MPNTLSQTWVKNVYSLRKVGGIKSGLLYTTTTLLTVFTQNTVYKLSRLPHNIPRLTPPLSTRILSILYLLKSNLYPVSTPLIITKTREN